MRRLLARLRRKSRYASGGIVYRADPGDDRIPAILSPCAHTQRRPGETWSEATDRLLRREGLEPCPPCCQHGQPGATQGNEGER